MLGEFFALDTPDVDGREGNRSLFKKYRIVPLLPRLHELQNLVRQPRIGGVDRIDLRHVAVLRQHLRVGASAGSFADISRRFLSSGPTWPIWPLICTDFSLSGWNIYCLRKS